MRISLIGYGKMGQTIEKIALQNGHEITFKIDRNNEEDLLKINNSNTDVAIEFTQPSSAVRNIIYCFENNVPVVCGTTGWLDKWEEVKKMCNQLNGTILYASNFSLGVNIFLN
ncbi:MAG: hypothetical protein JNK41_11820 [Saprospiraceae bacterium]|nr:hypothetical protein [Saprospiraceae bacterium]